MKIIKHGVQPVPKIRRFICGRCGCEFECEQGEFRVRNLHGTKYLQTFCPECDCHIVREL